nr:hypothetical protein [Bradyrhizobium canariense]
MAAADRMQLLPVAHIIMRIGGDLDHPDFDPALGGSSRAMRGSSLSDVGADSSI